MLSKFVFFLEIKNYRFELDNRLIIVNHKINFQNITGMARVLFLHPDLGIGGAERLVVDAATALQHCGHTVRIITNHHDPKHCFEETRNGQLSVETVGDWFPRTIFSKFAALCAYVRMIYASLYVTFWVSRREQIDIIFLDQVSVGIPILKYATGSPKILFYCHFPDQLLAERGGVLKEWYRLPLNLFEEITTGLADNVLVNSKFTRGIFKQTFKSLTVTPSVLYPSLNTKYFDQNSVVTVSDGIKSKLDENDIVFLSINRFDRKKNIPLALKAFKALESLVPENEWERCALIIAGGYDHRVTENVEHFDELFTQATQLGIIDKCHFLKSPNDKLKLWLISRCEALLYTPTNEHFGIVPLEAMYLQKPVVAVNSGGPTETVIHGSTGVLCTEGSVHEFAAALARFIGDRTLSGIWGAKGRKRVQQYFSYEAFEERLDNIVKELLNKDKNNKNT